MREQLSRNELSKIEGGAISAAQCKYLFAMCLAYPNGCTNPCVLWRNLCVK